MPLAAHYALERFTLLLCDRAMDAELDELCVSADRVERGTQFVTHHREELALCMIRIVGEYLRLLQLRGANQQLIVRGEKLLALHLELGRLIL